MNKTEAECKKVLEELRKNADPKAVAGMARFGINPNKTLGASIPVLRKMAKEIGKNHALADELWNSGIHEARILASMVDEPKKVSEKQMNEWAGEFDSWDVCDQVCMNLFSKTNFAYSKAMEWSKSETEFVKRAAFALIACLAWQDKKMGDKDFENLLSLIKKASLDERNFVKKAVNWALRQIGKRNKNLNKKAIACAKEIQKMDSKAAKWIAADALKELESEAVRKRL
ncbi:DNA alkylation repair protein [Candidatus Micrarchaeota archaeon]|nr:DNA alkylation repair protein [Candidatus Micrarchaeota archaeon]